jgi:hypothetical protein
MWNYNLVFLKKHITKMWKYFHGYEYKWYFGVLYKHQNICPIEQIPLMYVKLL